VREQIRWIRSMIWQNTGPTEDFSGMGKVVGHAACTPIHAQLELEGMVRNFSQERKIDGRRN
jgi:hypothetical protein